MDPHWLDPKNARETPYLVQLEELKEGIKFGGS